MSPELRYAKKILNYFDGLEIPTDKIFIGRHTQLFKWSNGKSIIELEVTYICREDFSIEFIRTEHIGIMDGDYINLSGDDFRKVEDIIFTKLYNTPQSFELL